MTLNQVGRIKTYKLNGDMDSVMQYEDTPTWTCAFHREVRHYIFAHLIYSYFD